MVLRVDTGKKETRPVFRNTKISIDTGDKTVHTGNIGLSASAVNQPRNQERVDDGSNKPRILINKNDSLQMKRGQKISLNQISSDLSKLMAGLEWKINNKSQEVFDLDVSIFMVDQSNKTAEENFIFYNNLKSKCGSITLAGDHHTGLNAGYKAAIAFNLDLVPLSIEKLAVTVTIDEAEDHGWNFGQVASGYFTMIDTINKKEILRYHFNEALTNETAIVVAELYRYKNEWKINTIGSGFNGGLEALCHNYGIETE